MAVSDFTPLHSLTHFNQSVSDMEDIPAPLHRCIWPGKWKTAIEHQIDNAPKCRKWRAWQRSALCSPTSDRGL
jgi:hypothetical protein